MSNNMRELDTIIEKMDAAATLAQQSGGNLSWKYPREWAHELRSLRPSAVEAAPKVEARIPIGSRVRALGGCDGRFPPGAVGVLMEYDDDSVRIRFDKAAGVEDTGSGASGRDWWEADDRIELEVSTTAAAPAPVAEICWAIGDKVFGQPTGMDALEYANARVYADCANDSRFPKLDKLRELFAAPTSAPTPADWAHTDDIAVDRFAAALKAKLAEARAKGRGGWDTDECNAQMLSDMLRDHVTKGDPRDVGNFAMFLHQRGEAILPPTPDRATPGERDALHQRLIDAWCADDFTALEAVLNDALTQPIASSEAAPEVCGAPKDGRACYPDCDCDTEHECEYGTVSEAAHGEQDRVDAAKTIHRIAAQLANDDCHGDAADLVDALDALIRRQPAAAPGAVDEEAIARIMDAQPFAHQNDSVRVWQLFQPSVHVGDALREILGLAQQTPRMGGEDSNA